MYFYDYTPYTMRWQIKHVGPIDIGVVLGGGGGVGGGCIIWLDNVVDKEADHYTVIS